MRKWCVLLTTITVGLASAGIANAQYTMPATTTVVGGGAGGSTGGFVSGFTPTNIVNQPVNIGGAKPINIQQATMPTQQSTKVFNISSAFSKVQMPLFRSGAPNVPIAQPGPTNPIQPVANPQLKPIPASAAIAAQQKRLLGIMPWY